MRILHSPAGGESSTNFGVVELDAKSKPRVRRVLLWTMRDKVEAAGDLIASCQTGTLQA